MNQSDIKAINELKILSIDMINGAKSGNPGIVLDMAPVMYTLFARVLNVYPKNPTFFNHSSTHFRSKSVIFTRNNLKKMIILEFFFLICLPLNGDILIFGVCDGGC